MAYFALAYICAPTLLMTVSFILQLSHLVELRRLTPGRFRVAAPRGETIHSLIWDSAGGMPVLARWRAFSAGLGPARDGRSGQLPRAAPCRAGHGRPGSAEADVLVTSLTLANQNTRLPLVVRLVAYFRDL